MKELEEKMKELEEKEEKVETQYLTKTEKKDKNYQWLISMILRLYKKMQQ
jgi:hypothetical protein